MYSTAQDAMDVLDQVMTQTSVSPPRLSVGAASYTPGSLLKVENCK